MIFLGAELLRNSQKLETFFQSSVSTTKEVKMKQFWFRKWRDIVSQCVFEVWTNTWDHPRATTKEERHSLKLTAHFLFLMTNNFNLKWASKHNFPIYFLKRNSTISLKMNLPRICGSSDLWKSSRNLNLASEGLRCFFFKS